MAEEVLKTASTSSLKVFALGGLGEVGLNLTILECGDDILIIDCGVLFPDLHWLGLDLILPDFSYLIENESRIRGMVITHGHEDHIGAIPFLLKKIKVPIIYCSRFAGRLIAEKCQEHQVSKSLLTYPANAGDAFDVGCFNVEFIHITHSTLQSFALAIKTPLGIVVHSGDFKFDEKPYAGLPSDKKRLKAIGAMKPVLLLSDSTNSERCGHSESESSINRELKKLIKEAEGAVVVALFASNIHRVHQLIDLAGKLGRSVFLSGRSMLRYVHIAIEEGFLPVKLSLLNSLDDVSQFERKKILVLSTGSQGEARSSLLRLANNENSNLKIKKGDSVILSSRNIPGNERAISYVVNQLFKLGAKVHYEDQKHIHVSGHAYQSEQLELLRLIRPKNFIPIHGEFRHLSLHGETAREFGLKKENVSVIENGQVWELKRSDAPGTVTERIVTGRRWVFQDETGELDSQVLKDRKTVARAGLIIVECLTASRGTILIGTPKAVLTGFLCSEIKLGELKTLIEKACEVEFTNWVEDPLEQTTREQRVGAAARRCAKRALGVRPLVIVSFLQT